MELKFLGDFKKLIPMGYKFQKMFAMNYICYHKDNVWIWRKGKDVEIADFYSQSHLVLDYLIKNDFNIPNKFNIIVLNTETLEIEDYDIEKHEILISNLSDNEIVNFNKRYQKHFMRQETIDCVKQLKDMNLIEIDKVENK